MRSENGQQIPIIPLNLFDLEIPNSFKEYEVETGVFENFLLRDTELEIIEFFYMVDKGVISNKYVFKN